MEKIGVDRVAIGIAHKCVAVRKLMQILPIYRS